MYAVFALCLVAVGLVAGQGLPGGKNQLNLNNQDVYNKVSMMAMMAVNSYNAKSDEQVYEVLLKVTDATSQVVSGTIYQVTFYTAQTSCNKNKIDQHDVNVYTCPPDMDGVFHKCQVSLWSQPWTNTMLQITDHSCSVVPKSMVA